LESFSLSPEREKLTRASRFTTGELDPERCTPTFRIFTEVRFWLAYKVGATAYIWIMRTRAEVQHADPYSDLMGYWLGGTRRLRSIWFGWDANIELENASKKQRSFYVHDSRCSGTSASIGTSFPMRAARTIGGGPRVDVPMFRP